MHNLLARRDGALMAHACSQPPKNTFGEMLAGVPGVLLRLPLRPLDEAQRRSMAWITAPLRDDHLSGGLFVCKRHPTLLLSTAG
jgi:hypothetical protein